MSVLEKVPDHILPIFVVDAFSKKPFKGNGAAVCMLPFLEVVSKATKQSIAAEMKLSETVFITPQAAADTFENGSRFGLEWFTPTCEVSLCGHATLASAAVLFFAYNNKSGVIEFDTLSGVLKAKKLDKKKIQIDLPTYSFTSVDSDYKDLAKLIVGTLPVKRIVLSESKNLLIQLSDESTRKDLESIRTKDEELTLATSDIIGVIVTLNATNKKDCKDEDGDKYDFLSRYFAPWLGVSEDPVTGSAHSVLAPFWAGPLQKNSFYARQCSQRGGDLNVVLADDRVYLSGDAVIVIQGQINF